MVDGIVHQAGHLACVVAVAGGAHHSIFQDCKANELFSMLSFDNLTFDQANKLFTASRLLESIENATSIYLSNLRQLFSVTAYDALVQT